MIHGEIERDVVAEAARAWTYEDVVAAGLDPKHHDIVAGVPVERRPVSQEGSISWVRLGAAVHGHVEAHRLGLFGFNGRFRLRDEPRTERRPDMHFVRAARAPARPLPHVLPGAPDLAIEVVSPSDSQSEVAEKARDYLEAGGEEVWLVFPELQIITVFRAGRRPRSYSPGDTLESPALLPGFALSLDELFPPIQP